MGSKRKAPGNTRKKQDEAGKADARELHARKTPEEAVIAPGKTRFPIRLDSTALLLGAVLLVALAVRLLPLTFSLSGGHVVFTEFDPYYHMRRIVYTVAHYPFVNSFDSYVNYPQGFGISWPPLFDLIAATLSLIVGLGAPSRSTIELVSATVPVLLGLASIVLTYFIVKDVLGKHAALLAALFMAVLPAAAFRTAFAYTDHHALEVFVSLAMYLFFTRALAAAREEKLSLTGLPKAKKTIIYTILAGIALSAMVFTWDGAPIFAAVIVAYAFLQYAYDAYRREDTLYLTIVGAATALIAVAIVAPFAIASQAGQQFAITAMYLSWFHVLYLLAIALFFIAMGGLSRLFSILKAPWFSAVVVAIVAGALLLVVVKLALPPVYNELQAGIQYLMGSSDVLVTIVEVEPLFSNGGQFSYDIPWVYFSTGGILAILGIIAYFLTRKLKALKNAEIFLIVWTLIVLALGLMQKRFIYLLAVNVAVFAGFALYEALTLSGIYRYVDSTDNKKKASSREGWLTPPVVAVGIVSVVLFIPILMNVAAVVGTQEFYSLDWNVACQWVDDHTPKTSYTYSADQGTHPEYGIMSWWDYGNYILYKAERPAVANNFQTGIPDAARFFIAQNESDASAIMDKVTAKYVMLDQRLGSPWAGETNGVFENMPYLAGEDTGSYHLSYRMPVPYGSDQMLDGSDKYYESMYSRLFYEDGLGGKNKLGYLDDGLQRYRIIFATDGTDPVKVFEYVKGATISGRATPGAGLELSLNVTTPDGDRTYVSRATAGADGAYSFTVPYPTSATVGAVHTGAAYTIASTRSSVAIQVPADAVDNGTIVTAGGDL